ncbi:UNVERIFIED_CONTAM: alternate-type signal peptide domain-containing protein [Kocuria sp. CPCC 205316]|uniref:alternate-type signal peptide domain-containing protein n=1 Tax=Kocuria TaxID=57493 RepID=UPI0036DEC4BC
MNTASQTPQSESPVQGGKNRRAGKAVLAGAVAVGLLAAGGGTFSKWSDDKDVFAAGTSVSTGKLSLGTPSTPVWTDADGVIQLAGFQAVPGDVLTFKTSTVVQAEGKNLEGTLALGLPDVVQQAVQSGVLEYDLTMTGLADQDIEDDDVYTVQGDTDDDQKVTVTAKFTWNADSVDGLQGQGLTGLSLHDTQLLLSQTV